MPHVTRRRCLALCAATLATPSGASVPVQRWRGRALGAELRLDVVGADRAQAWRLWRQVSGELARIERSFSLLVISELTRLNATGVLAHPGAEMRAMMELANRVHAATDGAFDPSVQAIWLALAEGRDPVRAQAGWDRVQRGPDGIVLPAGMALTFNGIAQGWAADRIAGLMRAAGFANVLIDMGEISALGRNAEGLGWSAGIVAPDGQLLRRLRLQDRALATSSPGATRVGPSRHPHILHSTGRRPLWSTVSVSAPRAALADALSTAFCLMTEAEIARALACFPAATLAAID
jgi:thiamine biosynthesis lipoprotein